MERLETVTTVEEAPQGSPSRSRRISGSAVVFGMLLLGSVATLVMYVYWDQHTKPFRPLTEAIGRTFKHSLPKVEGGRHKRGPMTLRVALRVPFPPAENDPQTDELLEKVKQLVRQYQNLDGYETVQIHLFQMVPEDSAKSKRFEYTADEIARVPSERGASAP